MTDKNSSNMLITEVLRRSGLAALISTVTFLSVALVSIGGITSCSQSNNNKSEATDTTAKVSEDDDIKAETIATTEIVSNNTVSNKSQVQTIVDGKPVYYDIGAWSTENDEPYELEDLAQMQKVLGKVTSTDKNSLDYASNTAVKYRFMEGDDPYLDIIDSQDYFELGWYYANPNDTAEQKEMSIAHAEKAYKLAHHLMGEAGGELIRRMLTNQIVKDEVIEGKYVQLAKCEFYSCMLIMKKQDS